MRYGYTLTAYVKDSTNKVPVAKATFRSISLAMATKTLWSRDFRVEMLQEIDD